jgi:hypothetical protein
MVIELLGSTRIAVTAILVALLVEPVGAQDTGSALSTILQTATSKSYGAYLITAEGRPLYIFSARIRRAPPELMRTAAASTPAPSNGRHLLPVRAARSPARRSKLR